MREEPTKDDLEEIEEAESDPMLDEDDGIDEFDMDDEDDSGHDGISPDNLPPGSEDADNE